jgi:hypothetical protein
MFGACLLIQQAQAQFVPPPAPPPPPSVFNPSPQNTTVPQPSYTPLSPTTPSTTPSAAPSTPPGPGEGHRSQKRAPSTTTTEVASRGTRWDSVIAAIHLVFVSIRQRFTRGRPRACGGPAFMIMLRANSRAGVPGMGELRDLPVIRETDDAPLPATLVDRE